jgi:hypothetical protein
MYIREIHIENIRGFEKVDLDLDRGGGKYAGWTVIAGRNGTGKSTLLRALALSVVGPMASIALRGGFSGWVRSGAPHAEIRTQLDYDITDRFVGSGKIPAPPFWAGLRWEREPSGPEPKLTVPMKLNPANRSRIPERGPWSDNPLGWFVAGYGPFRRLSGAATDAQRIMSGPPRLSRLVTLFREDASLIESIQWLRDVYSRQLDRNRQKKDKEAAALWGLLDSVLRLLDDNLLPDQTTVGDFDMDGLWLDQRGLTFSVDQLSDGYQTVIALVLDLASHLHRCFGELKLEEHEGRLVARYPGVVLIDEMETHLHPAWQKRIGFWLKEHFPRIQFIVTTHSPFICQAADPNGLIRLRAPGDARPTAPVLGELFYRIVNGSADDAMVTELFGLEHAHSDRSEALRESVSTLEALVIQGKATTKQKAELKRLEVQLPGTMTTDVERALNRLTARLDARTTESSR